LVRPLRLKKMYFAAARAADSAAAARRNSLIHKVKRCAAGAWHG
jgi:hypothetical protein